MKPERPTNEVKRGTIRHWHAPTSDKGVEMLRLDRRLKEILDRWRAAKRQNPESWK